MDRIRSIVVPTDFSALSDAAAARAVILAQLDGATIHLVHALRFPLVATPYYQASIPAAMSEGVRRAAQQRLQEARKAIEERGVSTVTTEVHTPEDVVQAISAVAASQRADLVVMGTHGHGGLRHAFLGSVAERTLRSPSLRCPVLSVKEDRAMAEAPIERILLAVDFSAHSDRAVEVAASLGKRLGASLDVVHAFDLPPDYLAYATSFGAEFEQKVQASAAERLEDVHERLRAMKVPVTLHLRRGSPSAVIAEVARQIHGQLIVMGTRGNAGLSHVLLGSVAERTLRTAPCSVLTVKSQKEAS
ncbi:MAG: universal stress protein [Myxococcota bacterium]